MSYSLSALTPVTSVQRDPVQAALEMGAQGRIREALDLLSTPAEFSTDVYILRGDLQLALGQVKEAAGSYFTITASEPDNLYAQSNLGMCLGSLGRWDAAAEAFQAVLQYDPHRDEARLSLGGCFLHLKRYEDALSCFDRCWSGGARKRALFGRGVALQKLRRFDEAEANYERLLTLDPQAEEALSNLIAMSLEVFDLNRVERHSRRLLDLNPSSSAALKGLALAALENRDFGIAAGYFFPAVEGEPEIMQTGSGTRARTRGVAEYSVRREIYDNLSEAARRRPGGTARAVGAG